jgi:hypothetical protein
MSMIEARALGEGGVFPKPFRTLSRQARYTSGRSTRESCSLVGAIVCHTFRPEFANFANTDCNILMRERVYTASHWDTTPHHKRSATAASP